MNYQQSLFGGAVPLRDDLAGVLPAQYAAILAQYGLDANRQGIAARRLSEYGKPSAAWFHKVCADLVLDQATPAVKQGMMF